MDVFNKYLLNILDWYYYNKYLLLSPEITIQRFYHIPGSVLSASVEVTLHSNPMMKMKPRNIYNLAMLTLVCGARIQIQMMNSMAYCIGAVRNARTLENMLP